MIWINFRNILLYNQIRIHSLIISCLILFSISSLSVLNIDARNNQSDDSRIILLSNSDPFFNTLNGNGSFYNPYIINNSVLSSNLLLVNTSVHIIITNCSFLDYQTGLELVNVKNIVINQSNFSGNIYSIIIYNSSNISIKNNSFSNSRQIINIHSSKTINIENNKFSNSDDGIIIHQSELISVVMNSFSTNGYGMYVAGSNTVLISNNVFSTPGIYSIFLDFNVSLSHIFNNTFSGSVNDHGVFENNMWYNESTKTGNTYIYRNNYYQVNNTIPFAKLSFLKNNPTIGVTAQNDKSFGKISLLRLDSLSVVSGTSSTILYHYAQNYITTKAQTMTTFSTSSTNKLTYIEKETPTLFSLSDKGANTFIKKLGSPFVTTQSIYSSLMNKKGILPLHSNLLAVQQNDTSFLTEDDFKSTGKELLSEETFKAADLLTGTDNRELANLSTIAFDSPDNLDLKIFEYQQKLGFYDEEGNVLHDTLRTEDLIGGTNDVKKYTVLTAAFENFAVDAIDDPIRTAILNAYAEQGITLDSDNIDIQYLIDNSKSDVFYSNTLNSYIWQDTLKDIADFEKRQQQKDQYLPKITTNTLRLNFFTIPIASRSMNNDNVFLKFTAGDAQTFKRPLLKLDSLTVSKKAPTKVFTAGSSVVDNIATGLVAIRDQTSAGYKNSGFMISSGAENPTAFTNSFGKSYGSDITTITKANPASPPSKPQQDKSLAQQVVVDRKGVVDKIMSLLPWILGGMVVVFVGLILIVKFGRRPGTL